MNKTPEEAYRCLLGPNAPPFVSFRDASFGSASFYITLLDVFNGLHKALQCKFFDFSDFDVEEYEFYEVIENSKIKITTLTAMDIRVNESGLDQSN